jgi:asparagine synthase (glutamine-hydrolysing)
MYSRVSSYLISAVNKRCLTTERPIACLLSGGLDSSLIAALVNNFYNYNHLPNKLETYSIGLEGSEDLKYARIVADYLETNHTEIIVTEKEMFEAIPDVIKAIESYDTTSVRASIGNYLLGKYIAANSQAKVIFNGDGSDELLGGYLYMNNCPDDIEFDKETRRLLKDIHLFDVLRSDKSISSHGLEPRTPFLDRSFVNTVLSIPAYFRNHKNIQTINDTYNIYDKNKLPYEGIEKFLLRFSFSDGKFADYNDRQILPSEILWRKKEAFSDGVSNRGRSLYQILQEYIAIYMNVEEQTDIYKPSIETEKKYYKKLFDKFYPLCDHIVPYFWMPKYTDATDPSARTLSIYADSEK